MHKSITIRLHELCNERCLFCFQDHAERQNAKKLSDNEIFKLILGSYKLGYRMIEFTGGEPLIHKKILLYIQFAKKVGFEQVYIQTNGVRLGSKQFTSECIKAGAKLYHISIHHCDAEVHDYLVQLPGAFQKVEKGIEYALSLGAYVGIHIVINKKNYKDLKKIVQFFISKGVIDFVLLFPEYEGSILQGDMNDIGVTYQEVQGYVVEYLGLFRQCHGKYIHAIHFPPCTLPQYEEHIISGLNVLIGNSDGNKYNYLEQLEKQNSYIDKCYSCQYHGKCKGINKNYLELFGEKSVEVDQDSNQGVGFTEYGNGFDQFLSFFIEKYDFHSEEECHKFMIANIFNDDYINVQCIPETFSGDDNDIDTIRHNINQDIRDSYARIKAEL